MKNTIILAFIIGIAGCDQVSVKQPVDVRVVNPISNLHCQQIEPFIFNLKGRDTIIEGPAFITGCQNPFNMTLTTLGDFPVTPDNCSQISIPRRFTATFGKTNEINFVWGYKLK